MDKKTAGLIGAVAGLATMGAAHAATSAAVNPANPLQPASYAELLAPVQNAVALVAADDAARAQQPLQSGADIVPVQYYRDGPAYHHHHHAYYRHHHHHHHHHSTFVGIPGVGGVVVGNR